MTVVLGMCLSGCVAPPVKMTETKSGSPEVVINKPRKITKGVILEAMANNGANIEQETDSMLRFSAPPTIAQNMMISLLVGNAYSANKVILEVTLLEQGSAATRVIGKAFAEAQMPFGQTRRDPINTPADYNQIQTQMNKWKTLAEAK